jgi:SAM-dependent methyltransferase
MHFRGSKAYDEKEFFNRYMNRKNRKDSPNNAIEKPLIYELIGNVENESILDLGCGNGAFGYELLSKGAKFYKGIEGSKLMAEDAKTNLKDLNGLICHQSMESYEFESETFDIVTSRFAIHYITNIEELFMEIHKSLKSNGKFIFSVQHPITTSSFASKGEGDRRENWIVDDYFVEGERNEPWMDKIVVKYHRTVEQYFQALTKAGFTVESLREGTPKRENFSSSEEYQRRMRIPVVLAFSCVK